MAAGIPEDPVTGAAHCALAPFWSERLGRAELLGYQSVPKPFRLERSEMIGKLADGENSEKLFGPGIIFDPLEKTLKWIDAPIGSFNKEKIEHLHKIAKGDEAAAAEGVAVLEILKAAVLKGKD